MENKDSEHFFNDLKGDLHAEEKTNSTEDTTDGGDVPDSIGTPHDELLRNMLSGYSPSARVEGWDKIAASLDATDETFDHQVRNRINQYHPAYDPHSWSKFTKRFSAHKHLRTRLIVLKLSEAAAILLLMLTVLHLGHKGRLPFQEPLAIESSSFNSQNQTPTLPQTEVSNPVALNQHLHTQTKHQPQAKTNRNADTKSNPVFAATEQAQQKTTDSGLEAGMTDADINSTQDPIFSGTDIETNSTPATDLQNESLIVENMNYADRDDASMVNFLAQPAPSVKHAKQNPIQAPTFVALANKTYVEFGMLAQADYNQLKMPEDRLSSDGKQIIFPLQGITSPGFGAGFTLAIGHPRWAFETGVIYNAKTFKPGRELTIGDEADNSNVEYEAMHMQLVSIPLQSRYRFNVKGRLKSYAFAGFGLHVIAQSDIDVKVDYNFPSLTEGEDPNNYPSLARTIRQTQRVSEDIRDKAPFSTNSYISANLGLGLEYSLVERKTLFLQTAYQFQVPNLRFSNHNGKHVLSLSLQVGVRTPLGT